MAANLSSAFFYADTNATNVFLTQLLNTTTTLNTTMDNISSVAQNDSVQIIPRSGPPSPASTEALIFLSMLFCSIGLVGIVGNFLVIFVVLLDRKMRGSVTNIFIMNLAVADSLILLFGIPEIALFMLNRGWLLGHTWCKIQRYILVFSLYASVMTLVSVCIER